MLSRRRLETSGLDLDRREDGIELGGVLRPAAADEPHYYLSALGVDPKRQGRGIGTALVRPVLDRCDRDRIPAYLETATERNVPLYERHGFSTVEELTLPGAGVHGWLMLRPAGFPNAATCARHRSLRSS